MLVCGRWCVSEICRHEFELAGWRVTLAGSRPDVRSFSGERPAVVLFDIAAPQDHPEAIVVALRLQFGPDLPLIATSPRPDHQLARDLGAKAFIRRPFEPLELLRLARDLAPEECRLPSGHRRGIA